MTPATTETFVPTPIQRERFERTIRSARKSLEKVLVQRPRAAQDPKFQGAQTLLELAEEQGPTPDSVRWYSGEDVYYWGIREGLIPSGFEWQSVRDYLVCE